MRRRYLAAIVPLLVVLVLAATLGADRSTQDAVPDGNVGAGQASEAAPPQATAGDEAATDMAARPSPPRVRHEGRGIFDNGHLLVAYYGTAGTGSLGVLGESPPNEMDRRLRRAARPFAKKGQRIQPVYELIVTIADPRPGPGGDFNHHLGRAQVKQYLRAARRHRALVLLDLQPGRDGFLNIAKHWRWALKDPAVGLALDPEWRMGRREVPGRVIGSVSAQEINRVSAWLAKLVKQEDLPEKLFVVHQFRSSMVRGIGNVKQRPGLALVQHVDGFGTRAQKRATYEVVARPDIFTMGLKLFYDEDINRIDPAYLRTLRPRVHFISFQ